MASSSSSTKRRRLNKSGKAFEGIVPPSITASSSSTRNKLSYDVFINHRGEVKETLAKDVYNALTDKGFEVFLDNKALEAGDLITIEIQEAMKSARLHIAIFSQGYAESPWCLAELYFMLETNTKIIPIFYLVEPTDLKWVAKRKGKYAKAFCDHEKNNRYSAQKLQEWKSALERVSDRSGYIVDTGYIVDRDDQWKGVLEKLQKKVAKEIKQPLLVSRDPLFGLEQTVEDFESKTIRSASYDYSAQIIGIVGMGGCGKTTLAKQVYNVYNRKFTPIQSSFLYDVRANELPKLQKKLLKHLNVPVGDSSFENEKEGMDIIAHRLRSLRMLVVLDDVDHKDQIDALVPPEHILGSGSWIIITTRDLNVLKSAGISSIYKMKGLPTSYAKKLFCSHAFPSCDPPQEFEDLIERFLSTCRGLPLSLKVFGKQLCGKDRKYWESQLNEFSRVLPDGIISTLQISYDALDRDEKELFLDIACFFIGERKSLVINVWDGMGHSGMRSLEKLIDKCLVDLDLKNRIRMHDHLRDLGRKMAKAKSPYRIWLEGQINRSSQQAREEMQIRGIMAATTSFFDIEGSCSSHYGPFEDGLCSHNWPLEECVDVMERLSLPLELLVLKGEFFSRKIGELSKGLVWLRWFDFDHALLPSYLSLRNLRVLELYQVQSIKTLWENNTNPPLKLRELIIQEQPSRDHNGSFQSFPKSIGRLKHLKRLVIHCRKESSLRSLPDEFCNLQSLKHLELEVFEMLSSLPSRFGNLINLKRVTLKRLSEQALTSLLTAFGGLSCLNKLYISSCNNSISLPTSLCNLSKLTILHIHDCSSLVFLPDSFCNLSNLTALHIHGCPNLQFLSYSFGDLSSLTTLHIGHCKKLKSFPNSLERLDLLEELKLVSLGVKSIPKAFRQLATLSKVSFES